MKINTSKNSCINAGTYARIMGLLLRRPSISFGVGAEFYSFLDNSNTGTGQFVTLKRGNMLYIYICITISVRNSFKKTLILSKYGPICYKTSLSAEKWNKF
jgi:hypothetical protein